jgi:hypothetical protein
MRSNRISHCHFGISRLMTVFLLRCETLGANRVYPADVPTRLRRHRSSPEFLQNYSARSASNLDVAGCTCANHAPWLFMLG